MTAPRVLLSRRQSTHVAHLYAVVVLDDAGAETVVRGASPDGPVELITDDPALVPTLLAAARATLPRAYLAHFTRAE